jgi:dinuclear metal center YbgI/SA1388 family protein
MNGSPALISEVVTFLDTFAPPALAEEWDNVGLLAGDPAEPVQKILTCLTITPASAAEAIESGCQLIVTHHPLPFKPLKRLTVDQTPSRLLWQLARAGVAIYSPHTAFDSTSEGINQRLAEGLLLEEIEPLMPPKLPTANQLGTGRRGKLQQPISVAELAERLKRFVKVPQIQAVASTDRLVQTVAVGCGSAGSFLPAVAAAKCDAFVTGEATFHTCLEAESLGIALLMPGHYASERFAVEELAKILAKQFPGVDCWASTREADPLCWL